MATRSASSSIDEYLTTFPPETKKVLKELRALIRAAAPGVSERISYGMPTFDLNGRHLVYFAGWKNHIGMYPATAGIVAALGEELDTYRNGKGSLQFPLDQALPIELIHRILRARVDEVAGSGR